MRNEIMNKSLLYLLLFALLGCSNEHPTNFSALPEHPNATNVQRYVDKLAKGVNSTTYQVNTPFPAEEVIAFIDRQLISKGFNCFKMPIGDIPEREWVSFDDRSGEWDNKQDMPPSRYLSTWASKENDEIVWGVLEYSNRSGGESWKNTAFISLQIAKLSEVINEAQQIEESTHNQRMKAARDRPPLK